MRTRNEGRPDTMASSSEVKVDYGRPSTCSICSPVTKTVYKRFPDPVSIRFQGVNHAYINF
jgi:hypothetical protein